MLLENRLLLKKTLIPNLFGLQIILLTLIIYFKTLKKYLKTQYKSVFPVSHTAGLSALTCLQLQTVPQCFCLSACFGEQVPECLGCPGWTSRAGGEGDGDSLAVCRRSLSGASVQRRLVDDGSGGRHAAVWRERTPPLLSGQTLGAKHADALYVHEKHKIIKTHSWISLCHSSYIIYCFAVLLQKADDHTWLSWLPQQLSWGASTRWSLSLFLLVV